MSNTMDRQEQLLQLLASRYADAYGKELLREQEALALSGAPQTSAQLEQRVKKAIRAKKRQGILRYSSMAAAACILLAVLAGGIFSLPFAGPAEPAPQGPAPAEHVPAEPAPPTAAPSSPTPSPQQGPTYAVIPMGFTPGEQFEVAAFEQDISRSIYYLEHAYDDDVVLTLEYREYAGAPDYAGLQAIPVGGETVYGAYRAAYSVITFEKEEVVYTMTCKYDINTLIELSEAILI